MSAVRKVLVGALMLVAITAGSATAGALISSAGIKDNTVGGADIRNASLTGRDVRDGSLELADLTGLAQGAKGILGLPGQQGTNGVPGVQYRQAARSLVAKAQVTVTSECEPGEKAIAGGVSSTAPDLLTVRRSFPDRNDWSVEVVNDSATQLTVFVWAVCIPD